MAKKGGPVAISLISGKYVLVRADLDGQSRLLSDAAVVQQDSVILEVGPYSTLRDRYHSIH